jgi:3D-(3,5/4)-trihydroxycyclohexane-1,2-dione acylhydrolase (decyclizing)
MCRPEWDWPVQLFDVRLWRVLRSLPEAGVLGQAIGAIRASRRSMIMAGGGVACSEAAQALREFAEAARIPVAETQTGKGSLSWNHLQAIGATGTTAANMLAAAESDLRVGIGTRCSGFTTASRSDVADPAVNAT